jgi:hypothetical protein
MDEIDISYCRIIDFDMLKDVIFALKDVDWMQ